MKQCFSCSIIFSSINILSILLIITDICYQGEKTAAQIWLNMKAFKYGWMNMNIDHFKRSTRLSKVFRDVHGLFTVLWILYSRMVNLNFKAFQFCFSLS